MEIPIKSRTEEVREEILALTREYARLKHRSYLPASERDEVRRSRGFTIPSENQSVPYAGRVFGEEEVEAAVGSALDFWLTLGGEGDQFERELSKYLGVRSSMLVNSGSSANLLAVSALSSSKLKDKRLKRGDEIITVAAGFPTTVAPIVQNGFIPAFVDIDLATLNIDVGLLEEAFVEGRSKAVMIAHTLGNPFDLGSVQQFCEDRGLWLIEDNCDALGSLYDSRPTGSFGDLSTQSFYPPHHITLGEGGAVNLVRSGRFKRILGSLRDWGRDCWCASGCDNTCGRRFEWEFGSLPPGYDHKFVYSHFGYNLKPLDLQAAIGRKQLLRLPEFVRSRIENWHYLRRGPQDLGEFFEFMLPTHAIEWTEDGFRWDDSGHRTQPSWFGFMIRVRPDAPFTKVDLARHLDELKIATRMLFGGNLVRQPAYVQLAKDDPGAFRIIGDLERTDRVMSEAFFIGVYPGLTVQMLDHAIEVMQDFCRNF